MEFVRKRIIDSHVHLGRFDASKSFKLSEPQILGNLEVGLPELKRYIELNNLSKVFLLTHPSKLDYQLLNTQRILDLAGQYDYIVPFGVPDVNNFEEYVIKGLKGIGEIKFPFRADNGKILEVLIEAERWGLPSIIHTTDWYCFNPEALKGFKKVGKIIFHGWGVWNNLETLETLLEDPRFYVDISANSGYFALLNNPKEQVQALFDKHYTKILYGTDFPMLMKGQCSQFGTNRLHLELLDKFRLGSVQLDHILYQNAYNLFKGE